METQSVAPAETIAPAPHVAIDMFQCGSKCYKCPNPLVEEEEPQVLVPCGHTLCKDCMQEIQDRCPCGKIKNSASVHLNYALQRCLTAVRQIPDIAAPYETAATSLELTCPICVEPFDEERMPYILACGHTHCLPCTEHFVQADGTILCPSRCHERSNVGDNKLALNVSVVDVMNSVKLQTQAPLISISSDMQSPELLVPRSQDEAEENFANLMQLIQGYAEERIRAYTSQIMAIQLYPPCLLWIYAFVLILVTGITPGFSPANQCKQIRGWLWYIGFAPCAIMNLEMVRRILIKRTLLMLSRWPHPVDPHRWPKLFVVLTMSILGIYWFIQLGAGIRYVWVAPAADCKSGMLMWTVAQWLVIFHIALWVFHSCVEAAYVCIAPNSKIIKDIHLAMLFHPVSTTFGRRTTLV